MNNRTGAVLPLEKAVNLKRFAAFSLSYGRKELIITGTVTIPKNCKKGSYVITVRAKKTADYKGKKCNVTIKIV